MGSRRYRAGMVQIAKSASISIASLTSTGPDKQKTSACPSLSRRVVKRPQYDMRECAQGGNNADIQNR